jgi:hypothetical protein
MLIIGAVVGLAAELASELASGLDAAETMREENQL